ncbi:MAG TPA: TIGR01777 family oxidoreductase [Thermodesulfobacteriota bacterium]|nr:TIGR01777 family oxidoreductase [Thermodesulfobacteriota bacterium]HNU70288.1 TIGR01777 family oxidoreductase [Thermodesulfobacteriota bacterium]
MKVFLAGGTGFLGTCLCRAFIRQGHEVTVLARNPGKTAGLVPGIRVIRGDPSTEGDWQEQLAGHDVVINLTGTPIFQRWTKRVRKSILESRVLSTAHIIDAIRRRLPQEKSALFNASGVGYYGSCGDDVVDEKAEAGTTFLARVASQWEETALKAEEAGIRVVLCRFGIVFGRSGGALPKLRTQARLHLNTPWGSGEQWFSWIHENDVSRTIAFLLEHTDIRGPVNVSSPEPVKNRELSAILNDMLRKKPFLPTIPAWIVRSILGEFSEAFLTGQRVRPNVLTSHGFVFQFPTCREAVADLLHAGEE